jgi:hypothetical protein
VIHKLSQFLTFAVFFAASSVLPIGAVTLESLIGSTPATGLVIGNVDYYDFGWSTSCTVAADCTGLDPSGVTISTASGLPTGEAGFLLTDPLSVTSNGTNVIADVTLTYDAVIVGSGLISDVYLAGADTLNPPSSSGPPSGPGISIGETVTDLSTGAFLGKLEIQDPPADLSDSINLSPAAPSITVLKDIELESGTGTYLGIPYSASLTSIVQATSTTPEPRAYSLLLVGFFGAFVAINRRRRLTA